MGMKMPVTWQHRSIAAALVKMVRKDQSNQRRHSAAQEYYHRRFQTQLLKKEQLGLGKDDGKGEENEDEATTMRRSIMAELFAPYVPSEDGGRDGILTTNKDFDEADSKDSQSPPPTPNKGKSGSHTTFMGSLPQSSGASNTNPNFKQQQKGGKLSSASSTVRPKTTPCSKSKSKSKTKSSSTALHSHARSLFRATEPWNNLQDLQANRVTAFSDTSINASHAQGVIDKEAHSILRRLNVDKNRVVVYDRTQPMVHMRNVNKACMMTYPGSDTDCAEVSFGYQKVSG